MASMRLNGPLLCSMVSYSGVSKALGDVVGEGGLMSTSGGQCRRASMRHLTVT